MIGIEVNVDLAWVLVGILLATSVGLFAVLLGRLRRSQADLKACQRELAAQADVLRKTIEWDYREAERLKARTSAFAGFLRHLGFRPEAIEDDFGPTARGNRVHQVNIAQCIRTVLDGSALREVYSKSDLEPFIRNFEAWRDPRSPHGAPMRPILVGHQSPGPASNIVK